MKEIVLFKTTNGKYLTKTIFRETWSNMAIDVRGPQPPYSLWSDFPDTANFGKVYVSLGDPSGYKVTQALLKGDYKHWLTLMKCGWFVESKSVWDAELEAKLFSEGLDKIREVAGSEDKGALQAARYLADKGFKKAPAKGRPTSAQIEGALKQEVSDRQTVDDDFQRISLVK